MGKRWEASACAQYSSGNLAVILEMASRTVRCVSVRSGSWFWRYSVARAWTFRRGVDDEVFSSEDFTNLLAFAVHILAYCRQ